MTNQPSYGDMQTTEHAGSWSDYLAACVGEHGSALDVALLSRDQVKMVRRLQAGLTARAAAPALAPVKTAKAAPRRARGSKISLYCSCANCRSGSESLCLRD